VKLRIGTVIALISLVEANAGVVEKAEKPPRPSRVSQASDTLQSAVAAWSQKVNRPIEFYGRVLDEAEQPIAQASVSVIWNRIGPDGSFPTNTMSDHNGNFVIQGLSGATLGITVEKMGFYPVRSNQTHFSYSDLPGLEPFRPEATNPVVFHLRKKGATEKLLARNVRLMVPRNGTQTGFDPLRCKLSSDGPLLFSVLDIETKEKQRAPLALHISVSNGGIQVAEGEFPFEAPIQGYQQSIKFSSSQPPLNQLSSILQCFFYFGEPRQYGRLSFSRSVLNSKAGASHTYLNLQCLINQSGSRNLESDPNKFIQAVPEYYLRPETPQIDSLRPAD
jgi:hypothetical protein